MMRPWLLLAYAANLASGYWMEDIAHQGKAPYNIDPAYTVFRDVKDFGAKGDGVSEDSAAINAAISFGNRCNFGACNGTTTSPAIVYFPAGTYLVSQPIQVLYYTQLIGDPNSMPTIKATSRFFAGWSLAMIEADKYGSNSRLSYASINVFFRQIRNLVLDITAAPGPLSALHWPSSQATSIQNTVFKMSENTAMNHTGIFMEEGSGGFMGDLIFYGGVYGAQFGNQQYTMHNLTFVNAQTGIMQLWDWSWVYKSLTFINCTVGINMTAPAVGAITLLDSMFINTTTAVANGRDLSPPVGYPGRQSFITENVMFDNVNTALGGSTSTFLSGTPAGSSLLPNSILGNVYLPTGPHNVFATSEEWFPRPNLLLDQSGQYYSRSKPQYAGTPANLFLSARSFGARGDGVADDTAALNSLFANASSWYSRGAIAFLDAGYYKVTDTVLIPPNTRIVGEALSAVIMASGPKFADILHPKTVVQVGTQGQCGIAEWSDTIVSTQGATAGAVLIEYNLNARCNATSGTTSGMWDVHTRIGGFTGSQLQIEDCPAAPMNNTINTHCIAAYMSMHVTPQAADLYMENNWFWVADHDIDSQNNAQLEVYGGRGLFIESHLGRIWVVASSVEHHTLYQYQLADTRDIWMGQIQTETPYYQPNPRAPRPFTHVNYTIQDPDFLDDCRDLEGQSVSGTDIIAPCDMAWGLRVTNTSNAVIYGAGLYSFFNNYNGSCGNQTTPGKCQARLAAMGSQVSDVVLWGVNTIGSVSMVTEQDVDLALYDANRASWTDLIAMYKAG